MNAAGARRLLVVGCLVWGLFLVALAATKAPAQTAASRPKPPFRVLFSNDTSNIESCTSPFHKKGEPFRVEMLQATVDETAGAHVHMLQPGTGWARC